LHQTTDIQTFQVWGRKKLRFPPVVSGYMSRKVIETTWDVAYP